jgi:hypothetical protein
MNSNRAAVGAEDDNSDGSRFKSDVAACLSEADIAQIAQVARKPNLFYELVHRYSNICFGMKHM